MKKIINIILCILLVGCGGSSADPCGIKDCPVGIRMVHINSPLNFEYGDAEKIISEAIRFLNANTTVQFEYKGGLSMKDLNPDTATLSDFTTTKKRFRDYQNFFFDNPSVGGNYKNRELTVILDGPLLDSNGVVYTAGRANVCAIYNRGEIGVNYITPFTNSDITSASFSRPFEEMFNRATNVTAHEIGHLSGALHKDDCSICIMNGTGGKNAFANINDFIVDPTSNNEMEGCVRRSTRQAIISCKGGRNLRRCKKRAGIRHIRLRDVRFKGNTRNLDSFDNVIGEVFGD